MNPPARPGGGIDMQGLSLALIRGGAALVGLAVLFSF